jgi:hypothetical protein
MNKENKEDYERKTNYDLANSHKLTYRQEIEARYNQKSKVNLGLDLNDRNFKYILCRGNNSNIIRRVMQNRDHWSEFKSTFSTGLFQFKWAPVSKMINFETLSQHGCK